MTFRTEPFLNNSNKGFVPNPSWIGVIKVLYRRFCGKPFPWIPIKVPQKCFHFEPLHPTKRKGFIDAYFHLGCAKKSILPSKCISIIQYYRSSQLNPVSKQKIARFYFLKWHQKVFLCILILNTLNNTLMPFERVHSSNFLVWNGVRLWWTVVLNNRNGFRRQNAT